MKLLRAIFAVLLIHASAVSFVARSATAAGIDGIEAASDGGAGDASAPGDADTTGWNGKGGISAAVGCGFGIASLCLAPNPVSAFIVGFDCGLMLIDAGMTQDR